MGLPRTFSLPVLPKNNLSAKPYSFKTLKTLFKTHIFHEAFPDSRCLYPIILITLVTLAKVIVGCIYVYETLLMPILCCKLPEDRSCTFTIPCSAPVTAQCLAGLCAITGRMIQVELWHLLHKPAIF